MLAGRANAADLHDGEAYFDAFEQATHDRYRAVLKQYEAGSSTDVQLAVAQCQFIKAFADIEDLQWQDDAAEDLESCRKNLSERFASEPEAQLFVLSGLNGKQAIDFASKQLKQSGTWTAAQRARLHEALSVAYTAREQSDVAGTEAVAAAQLDPDTSELHTAIEYLATHARAAEARRLIEAATPAQDEFSAEQRLRAARHLSDADVALHELERTVAAGTRVDDYLAANVYLASGHADQARARLKAAPGPRETREQRSIRLNVALAVGDQDEAARALVRALLHPEESMLWMGGYAGLIYRMPSALWNRTLLPVTAALLGVLLLLAALPGFLLVPVHYRGLLRRLQHRRPTALFEHVRLRDAWFALAVSFIVPTVVWLVAAREHLGLTASASGHSIDYICAMVWSTLIGLVALVPLWRRLRWQELLGVRQRALAVLGTTIVAWLFVACIAFVAARLQALMGLSTSDTTHTRLVETIVRALHQHGGISLAFAVVALLAPLFEELVFRAALLGGLSRHITFGWANFWQAALFAVSHDDPPRLVFYFVTGLVCGWLTRRTRGLLASYLLHALNNSIALALLLLM